jgi:stage V sporulation protein G
VEITEIRIKLMESAEDRLRAFCSVTFDDDFVVRDLKIIEGNTGPFVAMPSRKLTAHCLSCGSKNHLRANYCNQCGEHLPPSPLSYDGQGRAKLYADVAHPINPRCREMIQRRVIEEFQVELSRSQQPGYVSRYDEDYGDAGEDEDRYRWNTPLPTEANSRRVDQAQPAATPPHSVRNDASAAVPKSAHEFGKGIFD